MSTVRIYSMIMFAAFMMGSEAALVWADSSHDHAEHTEAAKVVAKSSEPMPHARLDSAAQAQLNDLVTVYLVVSDRLAHDRLDRLAAPFEQMTLAARALSESGVEDVSTPAAQIVAAMPQKIDAIEPVRAAFQALTVPVIALVEKAPPSHVAGSDINKAYYPMKKAAWLQSGTDVLNPYYGSAMLRCGSIQGAVQTLAVPKE